MSTKGKRQLPCICRLYKNASDTIIAIDKVCITVEQNSINVGKIDTSGEILQKFDTYVDTIRKNRTLLHLEIGGSRVVATIQMIGTYDSIEENGGNFLIVQYDKNTPTENDLVTSLELAGIAKIGDTV